MHILELSDYTLPAIGAGCGLSNMYFALDEGQVCAIDPECPDDAHTFLRALATLQRPLKGTYRFMGNKMRLHRYQDLLPCKRQIGYIAPDAAMVSNLTIRENLLLGRYYFENSLTIDLDDQARQLCQTFGIANNLNRRPAELHPMDLQMAIAIREMCKQPRVLLLDRPEDFIGHAQFDRLADLFRSFIEKALPVVFLSYDRRFIRRFANRKILMTSGSLSSVAIR